MHKPIPVALLVACALSSACDPDADTGYENAAELVAVIEQAARNRDYETLSRHMADEFSYSFGRQPSQTSAIARYREQPELLDTMAKILKRNCAIDERGADTWFVCPAAALDEETAYYGWRAGFRQEEDGSWQFAWFVAGD